MYNSDLVRRLCGEISAEVDPQRALDLISLLRAIIQEDQEEIRTRMAFLARSYPIVISDINAAD